MRLNPSLVPPGLAASAINMRFRFGEPEPRKGLQVLNHLNNVSIAETVPWGTIYGVGMFNDPVTFQDYQIMAADGNVYLMLEQNLPVQLNLPAGVTITSEVYFTQAFNRVIMHRGADKDSLVMNDVPTGFEYIAQTEAGTGTLQIPNAERGIFFQNRVFIPNDNDEIAFSDIGDYTRYSINQEFRINQGSDEKLVNIYKFNDTTIIAFKENSVYALTNVFGDMSQARLDQVTDQFGLLAPNSIAQVGNDLWFLSELGVMSITQTTENKIQGVVLPASEKIQPLIRRINWKYAHNASAAYWDSRYYLSVPLDAAEVFGPDLVNGPYTTTLGDDVVLTVEAGQTYRWERADATRDTRLINGSDTYTETTDFVAQGTTVSISWGPPQTNQVISDTVRRVDKGVNNAVLVYDFFNQEWSGHDESPGTDFKRLFIGKHRQERRLFTYTTQGWAFLYEEGEDDQRPAPYVDVTFNAAARVQLLVDGDIDTANDRITWTGHGFADVTSEELARQISFKGTDLPAPLVQYTLYYVYRVDDDTISLHTTAAGSVDGSTSIVNLTDLGTGGREIVDAFRVNSGTVVVANNSPFTNAQDGAVGLLYDDGGANALWDAVDVTYGFDQSLPSPWSAPDTSTFKLVNGIRFTATNGRIPVILSTGTWNNLDYQNTQPIETEFVSRGYEGQGRSWTRFGLLHVDVATWDPQATITVITPGVSEQSQLLTDDTRDRVKYYRPHNQADYDLTNTNDDFLDPYREDYSVVLDGVGASTGLDLQTDGVALDHYQERRVSEHLNERDRYVQVKVTNNKGRVIIRGINIEGAPQPEREGSKV